MTAPGYRVWKDWERPDICKEIYLHLLIDEPFCKDCQSYWDEWTPAQHKKALRVGKAEYERYVMEDAGQDAVRNGYLT